MILIKKIVVVDLQICRKDNGKKNQLSRGTIFGEPKTGVWGRTATAFFVLEMCQKTSLY